MKFYGQLNPGTNVNPRDTHPVAKGWERDDSGDSDCEHGFGTAHCCDAEATWVHPATKDARPGEHYLRDHPAWEAVAYACDAHVPRQDTPTETVEAAEGWERCEPVDEEGLKNVCEHRECWPHGVPWSKDLPAARWTDGLDLYCDTHVPRAVPKAKPAETPHTFVVGHMGGSGSVWSLTYDRQGPHLACAEDLTWLSRPEPTA